MHQTKTKIKHEKSHTTKQSHSYHNDTKSIANKLEIQRRIATNNKKRRYYINYTKKWIGQTYTNFKCI